MYGMGLGYALNCVLRMLNIFSRGREPEVEGHGRHRLRLLNVKCFSFNIIYIINSFHFVLARSHQAMADATAECAPVTPTGRAMPATALWTPAPAWPATSRSVTSAGSVSVAPASARTPSSRDPTVRPALPALECASNTSMESVRLIHPLAIYLISVCLSVYPTCIYLSLYLSIYPVTVGLSILHLSIYIVSIHLPMCLSTTEMVPILHCTAPKLYSMYSLIQ